MKIKDLSPNESMGMKKVKTPKGVIGYLKSHWRTGVWLSNGKTSQVYPQFVDDLSDCQEWEIADTKDKVNCHIKIDIEFIDNRKNN